MPSLALGLEYNRGTAGSSRGPCTIDEQNAPAPLLPAPGNAVTFDAHIKTLFRDRYCKSMKFAFDLASFADVSLHAKAILERVRLGRMRCEGACPREYIDTFARWVATGKRE